MTFHHRLPRPASGRRASVRLCIPIPPGAGPRAALEAQAAFLIDLLDRLDPDPDLEETGDLEPSLGAPAMQGYREDLELDTADDEPSLGSLDCAMDQRRWNDGAADDREMAPVTGLRHRHVTRHAEVRP